jgi:hypothetical protein
MPGPCSVLRSALETTSYEVYGAWGGTMRTECHQVQTVIRTSEEMAYRDTRAEHVDHAFELLYDTRPCLRTAVRHAPRADQRVASPGRA